MKKLKLEKEPAGTSGKGPGSTGLPVLPVVLPVIVTIVQYREFWGGTSGEVPDSIG